MTLSHWIEEQKKLCEGATKVVGWYAHGRGEHPHPDYATVRGPFNRWLLVTPVAERYQHEVASQVDDAEFAAGAMNSLPKALEIIAVLSEALDIEELEGELGANDNQGGRFNDGASAILRQWIAANKEALRRADEIASLGKEDDV